MAQATKKVMKDGRLILSGCLVIRDNKENKENKDRNDKENKDKELLLLYRDKHSHYETPGGKVEFSECLDKDNPSVDDLRKTAERELVEELGPDFKYAPLEYFGSVKFTIPDGRLAVANKFVTKIISGTPVIAEPELFSKLEYLPVKDLDKYPVSPDLKLFFSKLISL
jgi:8-oxo-dGTP pyrophosphatase MutT (NUDIX family)